MYHLYAEKFYNEIWSQSIMYKRDRIIWMGNKGLANSIGIAGTCCRSNRNLICGSEKSK